ncbi:MFS transporter [Enterovirga aerilata]|uniref:MFS transporter n=1 Tax=Enterovirga aerilata TaxID=2730920 RepID=A0A849IED9_9HYPH|nr:MFS transporter [Enterovirga sp. DB1703]NNM74430.1 MFS transporter [Enterovirga sp. DB1703]
MAGSQAPAAAVERGPDGRASWLRLLVALTLSTLGGVGLWSVVVALPAVQAEFGTARGAASLPYVLAMIGFGFGAIAMGRLADRAGIVVPLAIGWVLLCAGYLAAGLAPNLLAYALAHALIGVGSSASFAPLLADISLWFVRRRGIAVAICASGNYLAGAIWPPLVQLGVAEFGWRPAHLAVGAICLVTMPALILALRPKPRFSAAATAAARPGFVPTRLPIGPGTLQLLLIVAGIACCVAMAMPQVHIVAYCGDLGYGPARGAEMLTLMLGFGIVSRVASGFVADRLGGLATLLVGSTLQALALLLYAFFDGLASLYVISILFGLFQGGIVPSYAIIVREYFPANEAASRVAICITATIVGMALGGWLSGVIFDLTGSYHAAFLHGLAWNLLNVGIAAYLLASRSRREPSATAPVPA